MSEVEIKTPDVEKQRCGFVAVIGAPNAGKSTLINALVGSKVTIVSPKVQTTRALVRGIALHGDAQIIFVDTPGIFEPKERLDHAMVAAAWEGEEGAEVVMVLVDASRKRIDGNTKAIIKRLAENKGEKTFILALNKIDLVKRETLLALAMELNTMLPFAATFMISALKSDGTKTMMDWIASKLPQSPWHFPADQVSDMPMRLLAAEITREKLFLALYRELPYALTVETEEWENFDNGSVKISQVIFIERDTQKAIVLGKGGAQIKEVGEKARLELEQILETRVHLNLFVKVNERWTQDPERLAVWGLDPSA